MGSNEALRKGGKNQERTQLIYQTNIDGIQETYEGKQRRLYRTKVQAFNPDLRPEAEVWMSYEFLWRVKPAHAELTPLRIPGEEAGCPLPV